MQGEHKGRNNLQSSGEKQTEEVCSNIRVVNEHKMKGKILLRPDMEGLWRSQTD